MSVLEAIVVVGITAIVFLGWMVAQTQRSIRLELHELTEAMKLIAASKRLSVYLSFEKKDGLPIDPKQFEANKDILLKRMLAELDEQITRKQVEKHPHCASWEIVGGRTGFDAFVDTRTQLDLTDGLKRLFVNKDLDAARKLIEEAVAAL